MESPVIHSWEGDATLISEYAMGVFVPFDCAQLQTLYDAVRKHVVGGRGGIQ